VDPQIFSPRPSADSDLRSASATVHSLGFTGGRIRSVYHRVN